MDKDDTSKILRDLGEMNRDFGLGKRYFVLVGGLLVMLMVWLVVWGRMNRLDEAEPLSPPAAETPTAR